MKRVLLLIPPGNRKIIRDTLYGCWHEPKFLDYLWPPEQLFQLKSILSDGNQVQVLDGRVLGSKTKGLAIDFRPDVIVINASLETVGEDIAFLEGMDARIILYGPDPTINPREILNHVPDAVLIRGEPEGVIRKAVESSIPGGPGICRRGKIAEDVALVDDYSCLPLPDIPGPMMGYNNPLAVHKDFFTMTVGRGCVSNCSFCQVPKMFKGKILYKGIDRIKNEIELIRSRGYREIFFRDANLTNRKDVVLEICGILKPMRMSWSCNSRVDTVDREMLQAMSGSGCHCIKFGVESDSQSALDRMGKGTTLKRIKEAFEDCRRSGIDPFVHLMIGMRGEPMEESKSLAGFALSLKATYASFDVLRKPGKETSRDEQRAHDLAFRIFYLNPGTIMRNLFGLRSSYQAYNKLRSTVRLWKAFYSLS